MEVDGAWCMLEIQGLTLENRFLLYQDWTKDVILETQSSDRYISIAWFCEHTRLCSVTTFVSAPKPMGLGQ